MKKMSKFRHIQIKIGNEPKKRNQRVLEHTNTKSRNITNYMDKSGSRTVRHAIETSTFNKSSVTNEKRVGRINKPVGNVDSKKKIRVNSQVLRNVKKPKEELNTTKKVTFSFEKRKVKPQNKNINKAIEETKNPKIRINLKKIEKKKNDDDDDNKNDKDKMINKYLKLQKMRTVAPKDIIKMKKVDNASKKIISRNRGVGMPLKMNITFNKTKNSFMDRKSKEVKKDKNYLTKKEKTVIINKFKFGKNNNNKKDVKDNDQNKIKKKVIVKSEEKAPKRKGILKNKKVVFNNKKEEKSNNTNSRSRSSSKSKSSKRSKSSKHSKSSKYSKSSKRSKSTNKSKSIHSSSTPTPSSSSYNSEDENENLKPSSLVKSITSLNKTYSKSEEQDKQNKKSEKKEKKTQSSDKKENPNSGDKQIINNVPNITSFRPPKPNGRKGSIILGTKYLRRRSMDNPYTRERLELLVNQMTFKQNGGNTLFLKNYENGQTYIKEITLIIKDKQTIQKHIKISSCTKAGCSGPGIVKTNQDAYFIKQNFLNNKEYFYIGVCDGHGEFGHVVSNFVINKLPSYIKDLSNESITSAFKKVNNEIYGNSKLNSNMSGTTVVSVVLTPNNVTCVNLGDSRAALFKYDNGLYYCKNLSRDHKPSEVDESRRINLCGGRIKRCYDEDHKRFVGPDRVWMKNKDEPGLAMTRSLGDKIAHNIGVSDEPEFKTFPYDGTEKFIIIASDGLWEYVNGEQCISIVKPFYEEGLDSQEAALALTKEAFRRWKRKEVAIDDITVVVIFFY